MLQKYLFISIYCFLLLLPYRGISQQFTPVYPELRVQERILPMAWLGGLNAPQVSSTDFNEDGFDDLYLFDRVGNVHLVFLHEGKAGSTNYTLAPNFISAFPDLEHWVILKDFNQDGVEDIFCYSDIPGIDGLAVYRGVRELGELRYERFDFDGVFNLASFPTNNGNKLPIFISKIDYPAVEDVDCDGDLDLLTFNISGGYAEWYKNLSVENGFAADSLLFALSDPCWGGFFESGLSSIVDLAAQAGDCFSPGAKDIRLRERHAGSTLMLFDPDQDGDLDLVLGDLSFNNLNYLENGGDCQQAWINQQDPNFPVIDSPVDIPTFPAAFSLDVNQDGEQDLLAAPNQALGSEDKNVLWWYSGSRNENGDKRFQFQANDLLVGDMFDVGTGANPTFADVNADGKLDLIVGNQERYSGGSIQSSLHLLINIGSADEPVFELVDEDYLGMQQFSPSAYHFSPSFGDMDGDGDMDILVGEVFGQLFYGENIAGPGNPIQIPNLVIGYQGIDVGLNSSPFIYDVNGDELPDLIIGEQNGNVNYFQNTGTMESPQFVSDPNTSPNNAFFAGVNTRAPGFLVGNSKPVLYESNDTLFLLSGSESGDLFLYQNLNPEQLNNWEELEEPQLPWRIGSKTAPALAQVDQNGFFEFIFGNERGGLSFYTSDIEAEIVSSNNTNPLPLFELHIYPNPTVDHAFITSSEIIEQLRVLSLEGQLLVAFQPNNHNYDLSLQGLSKGIYFVEVLTAKGRKTERIVVQ